MLARCLFLFMRFLIWLSPYRNISYIGHAWHATALLQEPHGSCSCLLKYQVSTGYELILRALPSPFRYICLQFLSMWKMCIKAYLIPYDHVHVIERIASASHPVCSSIPRRQLTPRNSRAAANSGMPTCPRINSDDAASAQPPAARSPVITSYRLLCVASAFSSSTSI